MASNMGLNFSYTLSPDENASWTKFKDFAKKVSGQEIKINLDIAGGNTNVDPLKKIVENVDRSGKALTSKVELIQERLYNSLNNLTIKADKNLLEGILPIDEISKQIDSLANSGKSLNQIRTEASQIRIELQQWGQVLSNDKALLEGINDLQGNIGKKIDEISKKKNSKHITQLKQETDEWLKSEIEAIKKTKEFQAATEAQKSAFNKLTNSMEINAYSVEGLSKQKAQLNQQLKEQRQLFEDRYLDEARRKYDDLQGSIKNLVVRYVSLQAILHNMKRYFQDAIRYTMDLDNAYTDVAISMDVTRQEFNEWTKTARTIAQANGQTTTSLMEMVKIYATAGESIEAVQDKLAGTAMIQNITQWDAEQTTSAVNSILSQYKLLEKEINGVTGNVSNAITYLGDNLIGISNALKIDNVKGIQEMVSAIDTSGSIVESAGGTMEWYMGITGALGEAMNATGAEVGNAMKMITARTLQQKQVIEDMGESVENFEIETANAEAALNDIGVSIRGQGGELRDLEDILGDVAAKWNDLSDSTQQFIGEKLAGNNRRSYFTAMMENYARVLELQQAGLNSSGELMKANEIRVESLAGQINILKDKMLAFSDGLQPAIAGGVQLASTLMDLVNGFGAIPSTITLVGTALLTFTDRGKQARDMMLLLGESHVKAIGNINTYIARNKVKIEDMKDEIAVGQQSINQILRDIEARKSQGKSITTLTTQLKTEQAALRTTQLELAKTTIKTYALQTAMSMGLSVAISAVISLAGKLVSAFKEFNHGRTLEGITESIGSLNEKVNSYTESVEKLNNVKADVSSMRKMVETINDENTSIEKQEELTNSVNEMLSGHASSYESIESVLNNENIALETRIGLLEQEAELQRQLKANEVMEEVSKTDLFGNTTFDNAMSQTENLANQLINAKKALDNKVSDIENGVVYSINGKASYIADASKEFTERVDSLVTDIKTSATNAGKIMSDYMTLYDAERIDDSQFEQLKERYLNTIEELKQALVEVGQEDIKIFNLFDEGEVEEVEEVTEEIVNHVQTAKEKLEEFFGEDYDSSNVRGAFDAVVSACGGVQEGTEEAKEALALLKQTFPQLSSEVDTLSEAIAYLGNKSMLETRAEAEELVEILDKLKESGQDALDTSTMTQLLNMYPELGSHINDVAYIQEFLNGKIQEMQQINDDVYSSLLATDENFWNQKIKNSDEWLAHEKDVQNAVTQLGAEMLGIQEQDFVDFINSKGGLRDVDLSNAKNAVDAEGKLSTDLLNQLLGWYSQYVGEKGGARITDLDNVAEFLNEQGGMEAKTIQELVTMWETYYNAKKAEIQSSLALLSNDIKAGNPYDDLGNLKPEQSAQLAALNKQMVKLEKSAAAMGNFFSSVTTSFKGVSSGLSQASASVGKIGSGTGSGSGSSSSGKGSSSGGSGKDVADLELLTDRYYKLNAVLTEVEKNLDKNRALQEQVSSKEEYKKLVEEEISLLKQKKTALENILKEQQKERQELKSTLSNSGFKFDSNGNITNAMERLQALTKAANSLSGEAKEAAIEQVKALQDLIEAYDELDDDTIPSTELEILELAKDITDLNKTLEENLKLIDNLGDRYFNLLREIAKVDNALSLNQAKQQNAHGKERAELLREEIELLQKRQKLVEQQKAETQKEVNEVKNELTKNGVKFNSDGTISNYDQLVKQLQDKANSLVGDSQDEAIENAENILDLIDKYVTLTEDTLPDLDVAWQDYANNIKEAQESIAEVVEETQKKISDAYQKYQNERYSKLKENLQKEKDAYNKAYEEEDFGRDLSKQQRTLDELAQQIAIYSRDTSLAGQQRLEELKKEYEAQQEVLNDMIRDKEKDLTNERFDEEIDKVDKELEDLLSAENIAKVVNEALQTGVIDLGDTVMNLNDFMLQSIQDQEEAYFALGSTIKDELIGNLETAKSLIQDMNVIPVLSGVDNYSRSSTVAPLTDVVSNRLQTSMYEQELILQGELSSLISRMQTNVSTADLSNINRSQSNTITVEMPVTVQGNLDNVTLDLLESRLTKQQDTIIKTISKALR